MAQNKIERAVKEALKKTGLPFEIITATGMSHKQVYLAGKKIGTLCLNGGPRRDEKQILSKIRQRVKDLNNESERPGPNSGRY